MGIATTSATQLARATPASRDRYVDLLRVGSLAVVIVGHWLMAVVVTGPDGSVRTTNLLAVTPALQPITWVLQVMPVFFLVGGFSHATGLASVWRRGGGYADFVRARASRLLRPTAVFVAGWLVLATLIEIAGHDTGLLRTAARTVAQPLWFIGVYLAVVALAPPMLRLHRRLGRYAAAVPVALGAGAAAVDLAYFGWQVPYLRYANVLLVWLAVHQLGFLYADGTLRRGGRRLAVLLAGGGLAGLLVLTGYGPYPVSMVGVPGERVSNMSPPTLALLVQAVWLTGLVLLLHGPATRWLRRQRVWAAVIAANGVSMTGFLWHLTALFAASAAALSLGVAMPAAGSPQWWLLRPAWLAVLVALTGVLIAVFRRAEAPLPRRAATPPRLPTQRRTASLDPASTQVRATGQNTTSDRVRPTGIRPTAVRARVAAIGGMVLCAVGVLGLSAVGFAGPLSGRSATLVVLPVTAPLSAAILAAGSGLLWAARPSSRRCSRAAPARAVAR